MKLICVDPYVSVSRRRPHRSPGYGAQAGAWDPATLANRAAALYTCDENKLRRMTVLQMTFEQVLTAALALRPEQKAVLVKTLQVAPGPSADPTRAQLIAELEALRAAGAFEHVTSLRNQFPPRR